MKTGVEGRRNRDGEIYLPRRLCSSPLSPAAVRSPHFSSFFSYQRPTMPISPMLVPRIYSRSFCISTATPSVVVSDATRLLELRISIYVCPLFQQLNNFHQEFLVKLVLSWW